MAFTGRASYDTGNFDGFAEDVSDIIGMISPFETPLLDRLGDPPRPAENVLHEWLEDSLNPNTIVTSTAIASSSSATTIMVHVAGAAVARYLQLGTILKHKNTGEYYQVTATATSSITVSRAFGATSVSSAAAGTELFVVSDAALEGADVTTDISRPRVRRNNYCQIFKKDIIVSGTVQAVTQLGNISDEYEYQKLQRIRETIRDLEKATIQGKVSGNSLGSASVYRTMKGLWDHIVTNSTSSATISPTVLDDAIQLAWNQGATDINYIMADANWKRVIDGWNVSRVLVGNDTDEYHRRVTLFEGTFGTFEVVLGRWMPQNSLMILAPDRVNVLPLKGRSYRYESVAKTGDSDKGMVYGEYTLEVKNEEGLSKVYNPG